MLLVLIQPAGYKTHYHMFANLQYYRQNCIFENW